MLNQTARRRLGHTLVIAGLLLTGVNAMSLEQPRYTVLYQDGDIEYRQYEGYLVAETVIDEIGSYKDAGNEGFRRLFRYISGGNRNQIKVPMTAPVSQMAASEKIAMTVPVQQAGAADGWRVAFTLPKKYTLATAPVPTDSRVAIREFPARLMAVLRYSGRWTERNFSRKTSMLLEAIAASRLEPIGEPASALYNPPFTPPFMRRNEIMVEVNRLPVTADTTAIDGAAPAPMTY